MDLMLMLRAELRRFFISVAQRQQRPGSGSRRDFLLERTANMQWLDLTPVLSPVRWAVVGAVATRLYMPERMTRDLDIAIVGSDSATVRKKLKDAGFTYRGELSVSGSSWTAPNGMALDVIEGTDDWWMGAIEDAQSNRDPQGLPVLSLPYLVLMKFRAGRVQDLADVTRMLGQANDESLASVRRIFLKHAPDDQEDLESLIKLGKLEIES